MERDLYLALGDSITAGHGATHPIHSFVHQFGAYIKEKLLAEKTVVVAQNGWTARDIWQASSQIDASVWERSNVLTLMAGGNDLRKLLRRQYLPLSCSSISPELVKQRLKEFEYHMGLLCRFIRAHNIPTVIVATVYNPVPNFPVAVHAIGSLNEIIKDIAKRNKFVLADVYKRFVTHEATYIEGYRDGRYEDLSIPFRRPIHPNNAGHLRIADTIIARFGDIKRNQRRHVPSEK